MDNSFSNLKKEFFLDPKITFLNHGSYGACPKPVFRAYRRYQEDLETSPVRFMQDRVFTLLEESRSALGDYVNCDKDDLIFLSNPTYAVGNIIYNLKLNPGDEVLSTNLEYGACDRMWIFDSEKKGYKYIQAEINLPIENKEIFLKNFWSYASQKTKYIFISQITSSTGMILPIEDISLEAKRRNIKMIIDGAHVPAHIDLDIKDLDPDYYVGALHKWLCCPKGVSFLYVKRINQTNIQPMVKSWGWGEEYTDFKNSVQLHSPSRFVNIFQWQGTRDMSAFLTVKDAINFQKDYNWDEVRLRSKMIVKNARNQITELTGMPKLCPDSWLGQMATILFPIKNISSFKRSLYNDFSIEIPVMRHRDHTAFRISIQGYNSEADIDRLINSLKVLSQN